MNIRVVKDYNEMSYQAAQLITEQITKKKKYGFRVSYR